MSLFTKDVLPPPDDLLNSDELRYLDKEKGELPKAPDWTQFDAPYTGPIAVLSAEDAVEAWRNQKATTVLPTGISSLDEAIGGGLAAGQVTMLLGYTGIGKSELARQIRMLMANDRRVLHIDVELGHRRVTTRDVSQLAGIPSPALNFQEELNDLQAEAVESALQEISGKNWHIATPGQGFELADLRACIDAHTEPGNLVILDSAQRLATVAPGASQREKMQNFMYWATDTARDLELAFLITGEQKRSQEGKRPDAEDALTSGAESRAIEYQSDCVIAMAQKGEEVENDSGGWERTVELVIGKTRDGRTGYIAETLKFIGPCWEMEVVTRQETLKNKVLAILGREPRPVSLEALRSELKKRKNTIRNVPGVLRASGEVSVVSGRSGGYFLSSKLSPESRSGGWDPLSSGN